VVRRHEDCAIDPSSFILILAQRAFAQGG